MGRAAMCALQSSARIAKVVVMEFTIMCPVDGSVEVGLEDIESVVLRSPNRADITFVCPHCGTEISVTALVPAFLLSALEALAENPTDDEAAKLIFVTDHSGEDHAFDDGRDVIDADDPRHDAYCEYFRRQLGSVVSVEDALDEIDSKTKVV